MKEHTQHKHFASIQEFEFLETSTLGKGSFGSVVLGLHIKTSKPFAIKIVDLNTINTQIGYKALQREISIHTSLDHPHIVKLWEIFQVENKLYMVMDYIENGNLFYYQNIKRVFDQSDAVIFFSQTLSAVSYLHKNNFLHRDLKPENLLLDRDKNIKICDFGWVAEDIQEKRTTFCGTYEYMAPEMIFEKQYDYKVDIWALGILLYELLHGFAPFQGETVNQVRGQMLKGQLQIDPNLSESVQDLIFNILKLNPEQRYTIQQINNHKWISFHQNEKIRKFKIFENKMKFLDNNEKRNKLYRMFINQKDKRILDILLDDGSKKDSSDIKKLVEDQSIQILKSKRNPKNDSQSKQNKVKQGMNIRLDKKQNQIKLIPSQNKGDQWSSLSKYGIKNKQNSIPLKCLGTSQKNIHNKSNIQHKNNVLEKTLQIQNFRGNYNYTSSNLYQNAGQRSKNRHRPQNSDLTTSYDHQIKLKKQCRLKTQNDTIKYPNKNIYDESSNYEYSAMKMRYHTESGEQNNTINLQRTANKRRQKNKANISHNISLKNNKNTLLKKNKSKQIIYENTTNNCKLIRQSLN